MEESAFDTELYLHNQVRTLKKYIKNKKQRLYLEIGGKLINDRHAARVLPGYGEDTKLELVKRLEKEGDVLLVISANDLLRGRVRGDFSIPYDQEIGRVLNELKKKGHVVKKVAISRLRAAEPVSDCVRGLEIILKNLGIESYRFYEIDLKKSFEDIQKVLLLNPYIEFSKELVLVAGAGGGSGKFDICLSQLFHELKMGHAPHYLKFEIFPVINLPLKHPLNLAFFAASADFYEIDGMSNWGNRNVENMRTLHLLGKHFPNQGRYLQKISARSFETLNQIETGILNSKIVQKEAAAEIARRLLRYKFEVEEGKEKVEVLDRVRRILAML